MTERPKLSWTSWGPGAKAGPAVLRAAQPGSESSLPEVDPGLAVWVLLTSCTQVCHAGVSRALTQGPVTAKADPELTGDILASLWPRRRQGKAQLRPP